jgi:hypothetical protein
MVTMNSEPLSLKPGDRVLIGRARYRENARIGVVAKVTSTQVVVGVKTSSAEYFTRHYLDYGRQVGGGMDCNYVLGVATPAQSAEWDSRVAKELHDRAADKIETELRSALRDELQESFPKMSSPEIRVSFGNDAWVVTLSGMSEDQVRALARLVDVK